MDVILTCVGVDRCCKEIKGSQVRYPHTCGGGP